MTGFAVTSLVGADASAATDQDQNSAIKIPSPDSDVALSDISCRGTDPTATCVEYEPEPGTLAPLALGFALLLGLPRRRARSAIDLCA